jgi:hypothetical protein
MDTDIETINKTQTAHFAKYEALATEIGVNALRDLVPATRKEITDALTAGDTALNTVDLTKWDKAAGALPERGNATTRTGFVWGPVPAAFKNHRSLSLGERVCVLKHVARYHMGGR